MLEMGCCVCEVNSLGLFRTSSYAMGLGFATQKKGFYLGTFPNQISITKSLKGFFIL